MLLGHNNNSNRVNKKSSLYHKFIVAFVCILRLALIPFTNANGPLNFPPFSTDTNKVNNTSYEYSIDPSIAVVTSTSRSQGINKAAVMSPIKRKANLTAVTWAHGVNSQYQLTDALNSSIDMIEADIVIGKTNGTYTEMPVMAHPPANSSDLSLDSFLQQIDQYNKENVKQMKGVKLDFKTIEAFEGSLDILAEIIPQITCPIWLNADIVSGPVNQTTTLPVDPKRFLKGCYQFKKAVLSIGWTTEWSSEHYIGHYTNRDISAMLDVIRSNPINYGQAITFPVRAGIAANSIDELHSLLNSLSDTNDCTLTIWSAHNDTVDVWRLRDLIYSVGLDRVYLDVPEDLCRHLGLSPTCDDTKNGGNSGVTSLLKFSLMGAGIILLSLFIGRKI